MRNASRIVLVISVLLGVGVAREDGAARAQARARSRPPIVTAKAAILVDNQTGEVLWQRNPDLPLPPASTTKIVTAMLALQSGRLDEPLSITPEAAHAPPSKISVRPGWKVRLRDLVYAILLNSANDASVAIAEGLSGSVRAFSEQMNQQARLLGATNTHFVNPNGLPAADHYSTARDLATMFAHAMRDPLFEHIVNTKTETVRPVAGSARRIALRNHNRLLGNYRIHVVGKTGWTIAAKKCFVGAARQNGREVVVAVMGSRDLWGDLKRLLEFALEGAPMPALEADEIQIAAAPSVWAGVGDSEDTEARPLAPTYSVHLGAFRYLRSAARLKNTVVHKGYRARIETVRVGRERRYRVAVGNYADRRAAEQAAASLKKAHRHLLPVVAAGS